MSTTSPVDNDVSMTNPTTDTASLEQESPTDKPGAADGFSMDYDLTEDTTHISNISTAAVKKYFNILNQIDEGQVELASTLYKSLDGSPLSSFLPDLKIVTLYAAKVLTQQATLTDVNQEYYLSTGLSLKQWTGCMTAMTCNFSSTEVLTGKEMSHFKVFISRLGHTPASCLFHVRQSVTAATQASRAWRAAVLTIGSHYLKKKPKTLENPKKRQVQTMLTTDNDSQLSLRTSVPTASKAVTITPSKPTGKQASTSETPKEASTHATASSKETSTRATASSKKQDKHPAKPKNFAVVDATEAFLSKQSLSGVTLTTTRVLIKLHIDPCKEDDTTDRALEIIGSMLEAYQKHDPQVVFLPWLFENWASLPPIMDRQDLASLSVSKFCPYTDGFRPKPNKLCWFKMVMSSEAPQHLLSNDSSNTSGWFDDNKCGAFLCAVQDSDNTIPMGDLLYSGPFVNLERVAASIQKWCLDRYKKTLKFGCHLKRNPDIPKSDSSRPFLLAESQIVHIKVDSAQAKLLKKVLHAGFNVRKKSPMMRPGLYGFRFQPDKTQMRPGTDGEERRNKCLQKHSGIVQKLTLITSFDIKELNNNSTIYRLTEATIKLCLKDLSSRRDFTHALIC
jgi:hypothetical protein